MHKFLNPLTLFLLVGSLSAFAADPFVGMWKLNVAKSKYDGTNKPPKEETVVIEEQGNQYAVTAKGIAADGSPISNKFTVLSTGGEAKFSEGGPPPGTSRVFAKRKADARSGGWTTMRDGKVIQTNQSVVSDDGKTMRANIKGTNAQGKSYETVEVFDRM